MKPAIIFYRSAEYEARPAAPATAERLRSPAWRLRVGFDSIMDAEDLALEQPVVERR